MPRGGPRRKFKWASPSTKKLVRIDESEHRFLNAIREARERDPEIDRLLAMPSTWEYVIQSLERATAGSPKTTTAAQRMIGEEFPVDDAEGKPRDSEQAAEAIRHLPRAGLQRHSGPRKETS